MRSTKFIRAGLAAACLVGAVTTGAQTPNSFPGALSLTDCIQLALAHNLDVQIERHSPTIARYQLRAAYGSYDPMFSFSAGETFVTYPSEVDPKKPGADLAYERTDDIFSSGLSGRLPGGLTYNLSASSDYFAARSQLPSTPVYPDGIRHTNEYVGTAGITLSQPLLKNFWMNADQLRIQTNRVHQKASDLALQQQVINTVTRVQLAYYELIYAREKVKVEEQALSLVQQLLAENRKRVAVGDLPPLAEKQAEAEVETTQSDLLLARQVMAEQQNALKALLTDDYRNWSDAELTPADPLVAVTQGFDRAESWQYALHHRPDLQHMRVDLERSDLIRRYRFNQLFPNLDLVGGYGGRAVNDTFSSTMDDLGDRKSPAYSYGVVLSLPLSNQGARNNYKASKETRAQAELQVRKLEQDILVQIDNAGRLVQTQFRRVASTHQARVFAEAALEAERRKLLNGESTSFIVLQLQRDLTAARSTEVRALADYNKAIAQLAFSEGSTLEKNHVSLDGK